MCQDYLSHERWNQAPKGLGGGGGNERGSISKRVLELVALLLK